MADDRLLTAEEFKKVIADAIEAGKFSIGIPKPEEIRLIVGEAQDTKTASMVAREIFKEIENTALWHNKVLHYNPDAWEAFKSRYVKEEG